MDPADIEELKPYDCTKNKKGHVTCTSQPPDSVLQPYGFQYKKQMVIKDKDGKPMGADGSGKGLRITDSGGGWEPGADKSIPKWDRTIGGKQVWAFNDDTFESVYPPSMNPPEAKYGNEIFACDRPLSGTYDTNCPKSGDWNYPGYQMFSPQQDGKPAQCAATFLVKPNPPPSGGKAPPDQSSTGQCAASAIGSQQLVPTAVSGGADAANAMEGATGGATCSTFQAQIQAKASMAIIASVSGSADTSMTHGCQQVNVQAQAYSTCQQTIACQMNSIAESVTSKTAIDNYMKVTIEGRVSCGNNFVIRQDNTVVIKASVKADVKIVTASANALKGLTSSSLQNLQKASTGTGATPASGKIVTNP